MLRRCSLGASEADEGPGGVTWGGLMAATADPTVATGILGVEIAEGGGNGGGATTWIPATDGGTGLESVLIKEFMTMNESALEPERHRLMSHLVLCRMGALGTTPTPGETWGTTGR